jgi:hypothetical protein
MICTWHRDSLLLIPDTTGAGSSRTSRDSAGAPVGSLNLPTTRNAVKERMR